MTNPNTLLRAQRILEAGMSCAKTSMARTRLSCAQLHLAGYAEPGYTDPASGIIATGDWNHESHYQDHVLVVDDDTMDRVAKLLEALGVELEWDDEWASCDECGGLVRTQADSYGWMRSYYAFDGSIVCANCVDPAEVLLDLEGKPGHALTLDEIDPSEHGYVRANAEDESYEHGWYGGQDDSPEAIAENLRNAGVERFLFRIDGVGQFDTRFSVYVHESEVDRLSGTPQGKCKEDPATVLARGLRECAVQMRKQEEVME